MRVDAPGFEARGLLNAAQTFLDYTGSASVLGGPQPRLCRSLFSRFVWGYHALI
ncbi:MAG UNVERIFIED_CONTAM: hypothetical protein LVR18_27465 [Planctomycetaceae bacterium]